MSWRGHQKTYLKQMLPGLIRFFPCFAACLIAALSSVAALPALAQRSGAQPFSQQQVVKMLGRHTPGIESRVQNRGINFEVTPKVEDCLRKHHASDEFIKLLRQIQPLPPPPQPPKSPPAAPPHSLRAEPPPARRSTASTSKPRGAQQPSTRTSSSAGPSILLHADIACVVFVDGTQVKALQAGETAVRPVGIGQHLVEASIPGLPVHWQRTISIDRGGQIVVETELQSVLGKMMSGQWSQIHNEVTTDKCPHDINDNWILRVSGKDDLVSKKTVTLEREVGEHLYPYAPSGCDLSSYQCAHAFPLALSLTNFAGGSIRFHSSAPLSENDMTNYTQWFTATPYRRFKNDEQSEKYCEEYHHMPAPGFTGVLIPISESKIRLKLDNPNLDVILTKE